jgi:hypothetical protein
MKSHAEPLKIRYFSRAAAREALADLARMGVDVKGARNHPVRLFGFPH